jgi:hypothetical protein
MRHRHFLHRLRRLERRRDSERSILIESFPLAVTEMFRVQERLYWFVFRIKLLTCILSKLLIFNIYKEVDYHWSMYKDYLRHAKKVRS